jgi:hypothetical protein
LRQNIFNALFARNSIRRQKEEMLGGRGLSHIWFARVVKSKYFCARLVGKCIRSKPWEKIESIV